jgi:hypothetical protein
MMIADIRKDGGLCLGKLRSTLFGRTLDAVLYGDDADCLAYAEKCAVYLENMPSELFSLLKKFSLRYCEDMREFFDPVSPEVPEGVSEENILHYARANCLIVERPKDSGVIAFGVEFSCAWEREHGMEWTIRDGRPLYVGDFMGISPWYADRVYETECRSYVYEDFSL